MLFALLAHEEISDPLPKRAPRLRRDFVVPVRGPVLRAATVELVVDHLADGVEKLYALIREMLSLVGLSRFAVLRYFSVVSNHGSIGLV